MIIKCLPLLLPFLLFFGTVRSQKQPFAQGNLALVFDAKSGRNSEHSAQMAKLMPLWCQATSNGYDRMPIKSARFVHVHPPPIQHHQARLSPAGDRAFLDFSTPSRLLVGISVVGKYRCEITTEAGDLISGNLFIYMRPVLVVNATMRLDQADEADPFAWVGPSNKVVVGQNALLHCPTVAYPKPKLFWSKDGEPLNLSRVVEGDDGPQLKYLMDGDKLHIRRVCGMDEGIYRCVARNEFPPKVDGPIEHYQLSLEQHLRVTNSLSWLPPLLVIIICLLLLVLIIYGCSAWKKHKYKQYNVAQKEKQLGNGNRDGDLEKQRLPPPDDE